MDINRTGIFDWFKKIAEKNNDDAQFNLGIMYYNGYGVQKNYELAYYWIKKSAFSGHPEAQYYLGLMYKNGYYTLKNLKLSEYWITKSGMNSILEYDLWNIL